MKILFLGAGGTGGYFGGRLAQSGADVSFLVRQARAENLKNNGLVIRSPNGLDKISVKTILAEDVSPIYDLIVLSCKSYDLDSSIRAIKPAVGEKTLIVPCLNGIRHIDILEKQFGSEKILGGLVYIFATLKPNGEVVQMDSMHSMIIGARTEAQKERCIEISKIFEKASFDFCLSGDIMQDMWEKFVFLSTFASTTCLFHGSIGEIVSTTFGQEIMLGVYNECRAISKAAGYVVREKTVEKNMSILTEKTSTRTSSMLRDMEAGGKIEADSIVGDMIMRGEKFGVDASLLKAVYTHLQVYQTRVNNSK